MRDASILAWVKVKPKPKQVRMYRFRMDFPEGIMTPDGPRGPFKKGDLVNEKMMSEAVWNVLLRRGAVEVYVASV